MWEAEIDLSGDVRERACGKLQFFRLSPFKVSYATFMLSTSQNLQV